MKKITLEIYVSDDFKVNTSELKELFGKKYNSNFWSIDSLKEVKLGFDGFANEIPIGQEIQYIDSE